MLSFIGAVVSHLAPALFQLVQWRNSHINMAFLKQLRPIPAHWQVINGSIETLQRTCLSKAMHSRCCYHRSRQCMQSQTWLCTHTQTPPTHTPALFRKSYYDGPHLNKKVSSRVRMCAPSTSASVSSTTRPYLSPSKPSSWVTHHTYTHTHTYSAHTRQTLHVCTQRFRMHTITRACTQHIHTTHACMHHQTICIM